MFGYPNLGPDCDPRTVEILHRRCWRRDIYLYAAFRLIVLGFYAFLIYQAVQITTGFLGPDALAAGIVLGLLFVSAFRAYCSNVRADEDRRIAEIDRQYGHD